MVGFDRQYEGWPSAVVHRRPRERLWAVLCRLVPQTAGAANRLVPQRPPRSNWTGHSPTTPPCRWVYQDGRRNNIPTWHSGEE